MSKTRAELHAELYQLDAALPLWRKAMPSNAAFVLQYESLSERILQGTAPTDREHVLAHLHGILASRDLAGLGHHPAASSGHSTVA